MTNLLNDTKILRTLSYQPFNSADCNLFFKLKSPHLGQSWVVELEKKEIRDIKKMYVKSFFIIEYQKNMDWNK